MKVVITGSLGNIGSPLTKELVQKGHTVTVISHNPERQKDIEAIGATAAIGSLRDAGFVAATLTGADALFAMVPPDFAEADQAAYYRSIVHNYAQAIQQSGIRHVVYLSSYGAHLDKGTGFIIGAHHAENILNTLPVVAITYLRAGYFYTNLYGFADMIRQAGFIGANYGGNDQIILVHPRDIAAAATEEIENSATGRKIRYVVSDERTASEIARELGAAIGKPDLQWLTFTDEQMRKGMEERGLPAHVINNLAEIGAGIHNGTLGAHYEQEKPHAIGRVKLEDFAKEFAATFNR